MGLHLKRHTGLLRNPLAHRTLQHQRSKAPEGLAALDLQVQDVPYIGTVLAPSPTTCLLIESTPFPCPRPAHPLPHPFPQRPRAAVEAGDIGGPKHQPPVAVRRPTNNTQSARSAQASGGDSREGVG
jgi:hypothetical protein